MAQGAGEKIPMSEPVSVSIPAGPDVFGPWATLVFRGSEDAGRTIVGAVLTALSRAGEYVIDFGLGDPGEEARMTRWEVADYGVEGERFVPTAIQPNGQRVAIRVASSEAEPAELAARAITAQEFPRAQGQK